MKDLIARSYSAIRKRGLITLDTEFHEFFKKMEEELEEIRATQTFESFEFEDTIKETVDLMNVCICALVHHGFDPIK